ncbi:translocation protein SEC63 [Pancytospora philotis]|nr:translocation protein SEC63 [Pancytospora philotis]
MYQHNYDDSGLASSCLLLTLLIPILLWQSHKLWARMSARRCLCKNCAANPQPRPYTQLALLSLVVAVLSYFVYAASKVKVATGASGFDPYKVLNLEPDATTEQIRKAYKRTMMKLQRSLGGEDNKEMLEKALGAVNKAFGIIEDPSNYEEWLLENSEKKVIMALPSFVMEFKASSIGLYVLLIGVLVPLLAYWKYSSIKYKTATGAYFKTVERFFEVVDGLSTNEDVLYQQLLIFIAKTQEFSAIAWKKEVVAEEKAQIEAKYAVPLMGSGQSYLHIADYLARGGACDSAERRLISKMAVAMIEAFLRVAALKRKTALFKQLLSLRKAFIQAVVAPSHALMQIPGVDAEMLNRSENAVARKEKNLSPKIMEEFILGNMREPEQQRALSVLRNMPSIEISDLVAFVLNTENGDDNLVAPIARAISENNGTFRLEREAAAKISFKLKRRGSAAHCHAPLALEPFPNNWTVFYFINHQVHPNIITIDGDEREREVVLDLPMKDIKTVTVYAVSKGYFGIDASKSISVIYQ